MGIDYSVDADPDRTARAMLREREMSHKHSIELARELRGKTVEEAERYLEDVIEGEQAVPFRRFNSGTGHRSNIDGWDAGRYPEKVSEAFLDLFENVRNNADNQGFDPGEMRIAHLAAHKVGEVRGFKPRAMGRATEWNTPQVDVELVIEEVTEDDG